MLTSVQAQAIARQMKSAQDEAQLIPPWSMRVASFELKDAYRIADLIHAERIMEGGMPVGRKIGFTNAGMWARYGVHDPIWAYMYDATVERVANGSAVCSLARFVQPKIEPEIVFHFADTPPVDGDLPAIVASIDWVAHGFELVQCHYPGWSFEATDTVVDASLHGRLLLGEPQPIASLGADPLSTLETFSLTLNCDNKVVETGSGAAVLGSPVRALAHLIAVLARQPDRPPLQAGEIVTTGTVTLAHPVRAGERWHSALAGIDLPGLAVEFTA